MGIFIPIDITDLLRRTGHLSIAAQIVKEHESGVKIDSFQNIICHQNAQKGLRAFILLKSVVTFPDKGIAS